MALGLPPVVAWSLWDRGAPAWMAALMVFLFWGGALWEHFIMTRFRAGDAPGALKSALILLDRAAWMALGGVVLYAWINPGFMTA